MIIKRNRRAGTCRDGRAVDYLLRDTDRYNNPRPVTPKVLRGEPRLTKVLIKKSTAKKHVFQSLIISWGPDDKPTEEQIEQIISICQDILLPGLDKGRYYLFVVLHDGPTPHLHWIIPSVDLRRKYSLTLTYYRSFSRVARSLQRVLNLVYGWRHPDGWYVCEDGNVLTLNNSGRYQADPSCNEFIQCWDDLEKSLGFYVDWVCKRYHVQQEELKRWRERLMGIKYWLSKQLETRLSREYERFSILVSSDLGARRSSVGSQSRVEVAEHRAAMGRNANHTVADQATKQSLAGSKADNMRATSNRTPTRYKESLVPCERPVKVLAARDVSKDFIKDKRQDRAARSGTNQHRQVPPARPTPVKERTSRNRGRRRTDDNDLDLGF